MTGTRIKHLMDFSLILFIPEGEFIISSGSFGNNAHGPGFRFICQGCVRNKALHASSSGRFLLELSTRTQRWKLIMESIPKWWFHFAFTWTKERGLSFYENGKRVMSSTKPEPIEKGTNDETQSELTIGRPNSIYKINNYGKFSIGHLVIWTNELSPFDLEIAFLILLTKNMKSISCCNQMKGRHRITCTMRSRASELNFEQRAIFD